MSIEDVIREVQVIQVADNDPLMVHTTTSRWGVEVLDTIGRVKPHPGRVHLPVMLARNSTPTWPVGSSGTSSLSRSRR